MTASNAKPLLQISLQSNRFDCDNLRVLRLSGSSAISQLYAFDLLVVCLDRKGLSIPDILGEAVTIIFDTVDEDHAQRIHGIIAEVDDHLADSAEQRAYRFRIMPRAKRLELGFMQEIFLGNTVPELLQGKLDRVGLSGEDVILQLQATYAPREFVVQYRETDLAFVSRLAEHVGISFYFHHGDEYDVMIFTDIAGGFGHGGKREADFHPRGDLASVFELHAEHRLASKYYTVHDYNYRLPQVAPRGEHELPPEVGYAGEVVEYGAHVKTAEEAATIARVRAEEHQARQLVYVGKSTLPFVQPGMRLTVSNHPDLDTLDLLIVEVTHEATQQVGHTNEKGSYVNSFRAITADRMYRPPRITPKPRIHGFLTGIIDEAGYGTDKHAPIDDQGRYLVRFLFDTAGRNERQASHRVRMLQNHAGTGYGTHFPLKADVEVLLAFVDGDPDRPLIVGAVPNPLTPSPVVLAENSSGRIQTSSGIRVTFRDK
ncbi:MAG TPA: type VI secretion system tip protein TssI/VgrG [Polyangium sp.]|nr:type VI secretion system tip protein TssI/VgrG [Polyangium sp.]